MWKPQTVAERRHEELAEPHFATFQRAMAIPDSRVLCRLPFPGHKIAVDLARTNSLLHCFIG